MTALVRLDAVPAIIARERALLAEIVDPAEAAAVERRAAAIAELTKRAGLAPPIQNEAVLYRAEALELLARLVDEARENGELPKQGRPEKTAEPRRFSAPDHRRVAEGRLIARTGAVAKVEAALAEHDGNPADVPVITHATILRAAKTGEVGSIKSSESNEWYTPAVYIDAARRALGEIDLDPASSEQANRTVQATRIYTAEDDGLAQPWAGRVFLNPPYGGAQAPFVGKLAEEISAGRVTAAIALVSAYSTDTRWFQPLWDGTLCFLTGRIKWDNPTGRQSSATIGSVFVYFGPEPDAFARAFARFGPIVRRWQAA